MLERLQNEGALANWENEGGHIQAQPRHREGYEEREEISGRDRPEERVDERRRGVQTAARLRGALSLEVGQGARR